VIQTIDTEQIKREARNSAIEDLLDGKLPISGFYVKPGKYDRSALSLSAIWCAIELISNSIALMPIDVKRKDKSTGNSENDKEHYLNNVFNGGQMTRFMLIKMMMVDLLCYGNGYAYIERNGKKVTSLRYLESTSVSVNYNPTTNDLFYLCSRVNNNKPIKPENMLHIYKNSKNGYEGFSILHVAKNAIDLAKATENAAADYYNKGLNIQGIIHGKAPMNKVQAEQAANSINQNLTGSQTYYKFLPFDLGFEPISQTAKDA
jgi:HK97 family phage portal protein